MNMKFILLFLSFLSLFSKELITPIPLDVEYNYEKAILGKKLFFDTRLSQDDTISCATCHIVDAGGDDNMSVSFGIKGQAGLRNSPTVLNARFNRFQFWDGSAKNLAQQAVGPIHNPVEMGTNFKEVISKISKDIQYLNDFKRLYSDGITQENIVEAIVEFENALTTPNSKFDKYLRGDKNILNEDELNGYMIFKDYGCISCHNGVNIGGNLMQKIGAVKKYDTEDFGLYNITKNEEDKFYFKVPSLRNIELTAPYFHDGKIQTLEEAVDNMINHQLGFALSQQEKKFILKFLKTLTGETPAILKESK